MPGGLRAVPADRDAAGAATIATCRISSSPSSRGSSTCCRRARPSAPPPPPSRPRSTWCARELITEKEALRRVEAQQVDATAPAPLRRWTRSRRRSARARAGARRQRLTGRGGGHGDLRRRPRRGGRARPASTIILVRRETSPDDYHGMIVAQGILTSQGGTGSHAAVVARGAGPASGRRLRRASAWITSARQFDAQSDRPDRARGRRHLD